MDPDPLGRKIIAGSGAEPGFDIRRGKNIFINIFCSREKGHLKENLNKFLKFFIMAYLEVLLDPISIKY